MCVLLIMLSGCTQSELPDIDNDVTQLKMLDITRNGDLINPYPEIDISQITSLPVYKASNVNIDPSYKKIMDLETEYMSPICDYKSSFYVDDEWHIWDYGYGIDLEHSFDSDICINDEVYTASNSGFHVYFRDVLQKKYSDIFSFPFDKCPLIEIDKSISCDEAVNILMPTVDTHIKKQGIIYPNNYSYTDYKYYAVAESVNNYGLILNFRPQELSSDKDILLDYFDLCNKISFEFQWYKKEEDELWKSDCVSLNINSSTTDNYEFIGEYDLITIEEAKEIIDNAGDDVFEFLFGRKGGEYDDIHIIYIADKQGYLRPVYATTNRNTHRVWTDAIKK